MKLLPKFLIGLVTLAIGCVITEKTGGNGEVNCVGPILIALGVIAMLISLCTSKA